MKRMLIPALLAALLLAGCGQAEPVPTEPQTVVVGGETYPADASTLDLRDKEITVEEYEQLRLALPGCEILWKLPFQGLRVGMETRQLTVETMTLEGLANLAYLEKLETIHIHSCPGMEVLDTLAEVVPDCAVTYNVALAGRQVPWNATSLTLTAGDLKAAMEAFAVLPGLRRVTVTDTVTDLDTMLVLRAAYPEITFRFTFLLFDRELSSDAEEVELAKIKMESVEEIERVLPLFNGLQKLVLLDTGLPSEELDALWKRHPETRVVWNVRFGYTTLRTDRTTLMPMIFGYDGLEEDLALHDKDLTELKYLVDLVVLDLGHHDMTNIEFVRTMKNLKYLIVADTPVVDLSPLAELKNLEYLEVFMNGLSDLSPLAECTGLVDINLSYNRITDITPLLALPNLENIWLAGNHLLAEEQRQLIVDTFPEARIVFWSKSSTGMGWRNLPRYYEQRDLLGMAYMEG